jgi:cell division protein FtsW
MRAPTLTPYSLFASAPLQALMRAPAQTARLLVPARGPGFIFTAALLAMLCALQLACLWGAPPAWYPAAIVVTAPAAGAELVLGQKELAAPQADRRHLALRRDPDGRWWIRNLAAGKQLILQRADADERMGAARLAAGQSFQVGAARFEVAAGDGRAIAFTRDGVRWSYDGAVLRRDGHALDGCADAHWPARMLGWWNRLAPRFVSVGRPLTFGGNVYCDNRLGLDGVTPGAAWIARADGHHGRLELGAGNPDGEAAALLVSGAGAPMENLREREQSLDGVDALIAGHTRFTLSQRDGRLALTPSRRITLYSAPDLRLPDGVAWTWRQRGLWSSDGGALHVALSVSLLLAVAAAVAGVCAELALPEGDAWHWRGAALAAAALLAGGIASLLLQRAGQPPAAALSLLLGGAALWCWLLAPGRLSLATGAAVVLLAAGLLAQLEMGLGGMESSWLRYYQKSAALLALGCGAGGLWRAWSRHAAQSGRPGLGQRGIEWSLVALAVVALAGLAAEVLWGDETGVFDLQPVELAKLALTFLAAHCLALRSGWLEQGSATPHWQRWLNLIAPVLLFVALTCLALVQVDDFSPLILLLVWTTAMAFAYALAARKTWLALALGTMVLAVVGAIVWLRCVGTDDLIQWGF